MRTDGLTKAFNAGGVVPAYTIVKPHSAAGQVVVGAAATDKLIGVSTEIASASGDRCDVFLGGIAEVIFGGTIAAGDLVTSDASGHAVATTTANNRVIGIALVAGVDGDIGPVLLQASNL